MTSLLVYTQNFWPRADYIFSALLPAVGIDNFNFTHNKTFFAEFSGPKINYSSQQITNNEFWIKPVDLLFEKEIKKQATDCFIYKETKAFFKTAESDFPFDIFAASFYLITRYEEYLPHKPDIYKRYAHENSIAFREGFLNIPLVNIWLQQFAKELLKKFPALHLTPQAFNFIPTYDIDIAWSYKQKGWLRNAGGLIKAMVNGEWAMVSERMHVLFGNKEDPFDNYKWLDELHNRHQLKPIYFFLLAQQNKDYDKNILPAKEALQRLIKQHSLKYDVGIHPSWQSGDKPELLKEEIEILQKITGKDVIKSRQHYIRMALPETYRRIIDAGIEEDHTMGYGSINGFRASYCLPYKWYDLQKEETTALTIYPFCFMDANSFFQQKYPLEAVLEEMKYYYGITKKVNGLLITIQHNHIEPRLTEFLEIIMK